MNVAFRDPRNAAEAGDAKDYRHVRAPAFQGAGLCQFCIGAAIRGVRLTIRKGRGSACAADMV